MTKCLVAALVVSLLPPPLSLKRHAVLVAFYRLALRSSPHTRSRCLPRHGEACPRPRPALGRPHKHTMAGKPGLLLCGSG